MRRTLNSSNSKTKYNRKRNLKKPLKFGKKSTKRHNVKYGGVEQVESNRNKSTKRQKLSHEEQPPPQQMQPRHSSPQSPSYPPLSKMPSRSQKIPKRQRSETIYTQQYPDCWAHVLSKIIGVGKNYW